MKRGDIFMTKKETFLYLRELGNTLQSIATSLQMSERTAKRWNKEYQANTLLRSHGLTGRPGNHGTTISEELIVKEYIDLCTLVQRDGKAQPYNFSYFVKYKLENKCSLSTFKLIMKKHLIASPFANSKTRISYNKQLKAKLKKVNDKGEAEQIKAIISLNEKVYFRRPRPEHAGMVSEIDACKDYWLGPTQSHLHAAYDPATKTINALWLEKEETTHGYYKILEQLINKKQVPMLFKGDCRSSFVINKKDAGALAHKDVNTQFGFVLMLLGAKMENSSEPVFKGGVERSFKTMQNHLKGEFRERNISTFDEANKYLYEIYLPWFNKTYGISPSKKQNKFLKINLTPEQTNELLSIRTFRKTDKANSIGYNNDLYSLYDQNMNKVAFKEKSAIQVLKSLDNVISANYMGMKLIMKKTSYVDLTRSQQDQFNSSRKVMPNFSSPDYHPWGYKVFATYLHSRGSLSRYLKK